MMKKYFIYLTYLLLFISCASNPTPGPTPGQQAMIDRKYGMFLHFGMNTYLDKEWSTGTDSAACFNPPADLPAKIAGWAATAKAAGMRSIVLPVKHHDGFCLWNTQYTDYNIAHPSIKNQVDVVKILSEACHQNGITFSMYYSLWDRHDPSYQKKDPYEYIKFMKAQLKELMTNYGEIGELWLDGVWDRKNEDWHLQEIYDYVKSLQPLCQISTNWTLNKRPADMREGDSIIYYPADFRLWDPYLPMENDPKIYSHHGQSYYLPFECTQTISVLGNWFYHESDTLFRDVEDLEEIFYKATRNDNCLLLNIPPDKNGNFHPVAVQRILELADKMNIRDGKPFPEHINPPISNLSKAKATASSVFKKDTLRYGAYYLTDGDVSTSWKCDDTTGWFILDLQSPETFQEIQVTEHNHYVKNFSIEVTDQQNNWRTIYTGKGLSDPSLNSFMGYGYGQIKLEKPVTTDKIRFNLFSASQQPAIYSVRFK